MVNALELTYKAFFFLRNPGFLNLMKFGMMVGEAKDKISQIPTFQV